MKLDSARWTFVIDKTCNMLALCRSLTLLRPKGETLSSHFILGHEGPKGQWPPPTSDKGVC